MNAAIALIFFACVAGSMASNAQSQFLEQLTQQGQAVAQTVVNHLQQQILALVGQAFGQLSGLVSSIGGRLDFNAVLEQFKPVLSSLVNQVLGQVLGSLSGLIGGRAEFNLSTIFADFIASIHGAVTGLGQHVLNQGLASVLGGLGSLGGSRGLGDILASLQAQISSAASVAQGVLQGALSNITALGANIVDASKPHFADLQSQLVGHGLNVLGSLSETINNVHGSIVGRP